jgi:hypothetical protein
MRHDARKAGQGRLSALSPKFTEIHAVTEIREIQ